MEPPAKRPATSSTDPPSVLTVLTGGTVLTPRDRQSCDVVLAGGRVIALPPRGTSAAFVALPGATVIDVSGMLVIPGLVDCHVHVTGGGGEMGPASRTPEAKLAELVAAGCTTVVGILGTDSVSRSLENLLFKLRALEHDGLTTLMWTGAYQVPLPTLTGSVKRDVTLIDKVLGVGELAISDHRGSQITVEQLCHIAAEAHVGGMTAGKAGLVHLHVGAHRTGLQPVFDAVEASALPVSCFYPTHVSSRGEKLLQDTLQWLRMGGRCDLTACGDDDETVDALNRIRAASPQLLDQVSLSSDAYGSCPSFNTHGELVGYNVALPGEQLAVLRRLVAAGWALEEALPLMTANPARILKLQGKGVVAVGADADLVVLHSQDLTVSRVFARGVQLLGPDGRRAKGMFD
jgi:beta-aspartyl-dipeptidase (metallo-type)